VFLMMLNDDLDMLLFEYVEDKCGVICVTHMWWIN
jgi:hypothetical protein